MTDGRALRAAIVGCGPAGMYAAGHLLEPPSGTFVGGRLMRRVRQAIEVDVLDRLPTPWGLIRGGVAPDHPDKKQMARTYDAIARRPGFRFFGNIHVGETVSPAELADWYDAVIYAFGADDERSLGIEGEKLPGCHSARRFVGWYNGHPDFRDETFNLQTERVVVIGNGNVSMDVARILLKPIEELRKTDIAAHALEALSQSQVKEIVILGRRGPENAAFSFPELEELGELPDTAISIEDDRALQTILDAKQGERPESTILRRLCERHSSGQRRIRLKFHATPAEILGKDHVEGVRLDSDNEMLTCGQVFSAIGYRGRALPGMPFDEVSGIVPSDACGRVMDGIQPVPGVYVAGWIRRGARGIIGTNKKCARDVVGALLEDAQNNVLQDRNTLNADQCLDKLLERSSSLVQYPGWQQIDRFEREQGRLASRPRIKLASINEMLDVVTN